MDFKQFVFWCVLVVVVAPTGVYLCARAGAFAWFRTKRKHFHNVLKDMKDGE